MRVFKILKTQQQVEIQQQEEREREVLAQQVLRISTLGLSNKPIIYTRLIPAPPQNNNKRDYIPNRQHKY